jgi:hypothetical protein
MFKLYLTSILVAEVVAVVAVASLADLSLWFLVPIVALTASAVSRPRPSPATEPLIPTPTPPKRSPAP